MTMIQNTNYLDYDGGIISYGDILKIRDLESQPRSKYSPKIPFAMIVRKDNKDMLYVSGVDEFLEMSEVSINDDGRTLPEFSIFAPRLSYEGNGAGSTKLVEESKEGLC